MPVTIHCNERIEWQGKFANTMKHGLANLGIYSEVTDVAYRCDEIAILLGTTFWRGIENDGGKYLLVDRASFGDPYYIQLVWNGHGRRGNHKVPEGAPAERWEKHVAPCLERYFKMTPEPLPWRGGGEQRVLCGQTETYSPHYSTVESWYGRVAHFATHWRPHPASPDFRPWGLTLGKARDLDNAELVITLNSSVACSTVYAGIPTVTMDEGAMAWDVTSHDPREIRTPERTDWLHWLAWTQWNYDEIEAGVPIEHLFGDM